ncbi:hypothetical protein JTB14_031193 [Gonioctena quinquepunctata]|nr:hypothetical protein JTB14_031193 [Gonioctena quinquepunctata]
MYDIKAQDKIIDATRNLGNNSLESIIPKGINKTGGHPSELKIFEGAKIMLRANTDVVKGFVNGTIAFISEIILPHFRRDRHCVN